MKILLTGATGYIGQRLLPVLTAAGHDVSCLVRDARRFAMPDTLPASQHPLVRVVEGDLLRPESLAGLPLDFDAAYYLVHSMSGTGEDFFLTGTGLGPALCRLPRPQHGPAGYLLIYLSVIANDHDLSVHLRSRQAVEDVLARARTGLLDKLVGGVGLRRGRCSPNHLRAGDPLDFWRVLVADRAAKRLLLYAEMKMPGEAWLQFRIIDNPDGSHALEQLATYRPQGLLGRLYWYSVLPFHGIIFKGMVKNLIRYGQ